MTNPRHTLLVPLNGHTEDELIGTNVKSSVSWDRLIPVIKHLISQKGNEEIIGLEVDENGVTAVIKYKKEM